MFYHVSIQQSIDLEPMYFGPKLRETICLKITDKVGSCNWHFNGMCSGAVGSPTYAITRGSRW